MVRCVCGGAFGGYRGVEGCTGLLGRPDWKNSFGRTGHWYDEIIKTDFQVI